MSVPHNKEQLRNLTAILLDTDRPSHSLWPEVKALTKILVDSQVAKYTLHQDISGGETRTENGLAISPTMAAMCTDDFMRTIAFIRGTHAAIVDIRNKFPDRAVHILYAGCGPYATLVVPLMSIFSPSEAVFTLLDIHSESIASAKSIVDTLSLSKSVVNMEVIDAGSYQICSERSPDIILIEVMLACLESEPQVAIARHLSSQASNAVMIPEEVRVDLTMVEQSKEFDLASLEGSGEEAQQDRIPVGPVFRLNRETVNLWEGNHANRLPGENIRIPESVEQRYQPMLFTEIRVYQEHILKNYDSGLTCPRPLSIEEEINAGDRLQFHYTLGQHPRLVGHVA